MAYLTSCPWDPVYLERSSDMNILLYVDLIFLFSQFMFLFLNPFVFVVQQKSDVRLLNYTITRFMLVRHFV